MRKWLIIFFVSLTLVAAGSGYYFLGGGSTVNIPMGVSSVTPKFYQLGTDSLRQYYVTGVGGSNRWYTATEVNLIARGKADSTRLYGTTLPLYEQTSRKTATQSSSTTNYPNWLGITNYVTGYIVPISQGGTGVTAVGTALQILQTNAGANGTQWYTPGTLSATNATLTFSSNYNPSSPTNRTVAINLANPNTWSGQQTFASPIFTGTPTTPTASPGTNNTQVASTSYVDAAVLSSARGRVVLSGNVSGILNYDYLNNTSSQYTITPPSTTGFANDGSKLMTGLVTGTGSIRVSCPTGYTIQTPSGNVTPTTGFATIIQNQKFQLIPVGVNAYYLQVLNGSVTVT